MKKTFLQHTKHRLLCILFKWSQRRKREIMSDSIDFPVLPLPQIRPSSNNTANTDRTLTVNNGRGKNGSDI